jgi:hypothetical protein
MGAFGKFLFIGVVTTILSFLLTWMVRMIPGVKKVLFLKVCSFSPFIAESG